MGLLLFAVEFVIDEVALIDSVWDGVHTFIRPAIGSYLASSATDTELSVAVMLYRTARRITRRVRAGRAAPPG